MTASAPSIELPTQNEGLENGAGKLSPMRSGLVAYFLTLVAGLAIFPARAQITPDLIRARTEREWTVKAEKMRQLAVVRRLEAAGFRAWPASSTAWIRRINWLKPYSTTSTPATMKYWPQ